MMKPDIEYKKPILRQKVRILRPKEYEMLLRAIPKPHHKTMFQTLLYTGMRYVEIKRFQNNPDWYDGDFIHLPKEAVLKEKRTQAERWVRLNHQGRMTVQYFNQLKKPLPSYQAWSKNLKLWATKAGLEPIGLSVKSSRKTWESWLMFCHPTHIAMITLSQGHTTLTSLQHYVNMPFTEADRLEIENYIQGWMPHNAKY